MREPKYELEIIVWDENGEKVTMQSTGLVSRLEMGPWAVLALTRINDRLRKIEEEK